jgi:hypothetical protein
MAENPSPFRDRDTLIPLADPWTAQSYIHLVDGLFMHRQSADFNISYIPPKSSDVFVKPRRGSEDRNQFERIKNLCAKFLDGARNGTAPLEVVKAHIVGRDSLEAVFVEHSRRTLVALGDLIATKVRHKIQLRLSPSARTLERRRTYATSFAHELASQAERIGKLIEHAPTVGSYREDLLRALIQRHIPRRFHAATGFIDGCPNQLDILIYDQIEYAPLFRLEDLAVVPPEAVRAIVEVKSDLTGNELANALAHLEEAQPLRVSGPPVFTGVFAFRGAAVPTLMNTIWSFHQPDKDGVIEHMIPDIGGLVSAVCVLQASVLTSYFARARDSQSLAPAIIELGSDAGRESQAAIFFDTCRAFCDTRSVTSWSAAQCDRFLMKTLQSTAAG